MAQLIRGRAVSDLAGAAVTQLGVETISALKSSPLLLVVVVLNVGMIFALLYVANAQRDERQLLTQRLFEACDKDPAK